ncbi:MAG TPA: aminotransferase class I/II-fold pyridoxal phosphate-dependent enzyme, partial [Saprospiraceae bacterium]|nr:aminotransferase class I/II-fold pyridoxal phosphate-dependent enzyme [Saprospiraceae bacterium]
AKRYRYNNNDMADLEERLKETQDCRRRMIATDGVFSMDGIIAQMDKIVALAEKYDAIVMVDDCHATGFVGKTGRGSAEHSGVFGKVDITTGTFGKALGGASGGFTAGSKEVIALLRQRSRPYLFSNTLAPSIVGASIAVLNMLGETTSLRDKLETNANYFRKGMTDAGFDIVPGVHPIVPVMLYDAKLSQVFADDLLKEGIYVIGFYYPVVPQGKARIRVQISAGHEREHLDKCLEAFIKVGKKHSVIK